MEKKYIMLSLHDEKSKQVSEILASSKAKEILNILFEKEASETDIATQLNIPVNTVEYHLKKLLEVGLIERSKTFFWSRKGKKIPTYKAANKTIVISPKPKSSVIPAFISVAICAVTAFLLRLYLAGKEKSVIIAEKAGEELLRSSKDFAESARDTAEQAGNNVMENLTSAISDSSGTAAYASFSIIHSIWLWFFIGAVFSLILFFLVRKAMKNR